MRSGPAPSSLATSVALHGAAIGWMFFGPSLEFTPEQKPQTLYQQAIAPQEKKIVWYSFRDKLPEVSPLERHGVSKLPRADARTRQQIVSKPPKAPRAKQMVWLPAPEIEWKHELPSPNMMAFEAPKIAPPVRPRPKIFAPPETKPAPAPAEPLPAAPQIAAAQQNAPKLADPRLPPKQFVAPEAKRASSPSPSMPDAPQIAAVQQHAPKLADPRLPPKQFVAPEAKRASSPSPSMPDAPQIAAVQQHAPKLADPRLPPKQFVGPEAKRASSSSPSMPDAPQIAAAQQPAPALADPRLPKQQPKSFAAPPQPKRDPGPSPFLPEAPLVANGATVAGGPRRFVGPVDPPRAGQPAPTIEAGPQLPATDAHGSLTAAIVGLNPVDNLRPPIPEGSRAAQFNGGAERRAHGGDGEVVETARIFVPDLMIRNGDQRPPAPATLVTRAAPTAPETLLGAVKSSVAVPSELRGRPLATRVTSSPDPRLAGRMIYTVAIQMPNVTSFMGSWIVWFAERQPVPGRLPVPAPPEIRSPVPLRKVDPKYIPAAAAERIEGKVQLAAVIRKDGRVDSLTLLKHLDDRLDRSAQEALQKWLFEPARRNGKPVDVDAVFEIPFRLAPLASR